jgi:hypothetical protein
MSIEQNLTGTAGEFFALFALSKMKFVCHHVPTDSYDALVRSGDKILRLQVKTRSSPSAVWGKYRPWYSFKTSKESGRNGNQRGGRVEASQYCDLLALVALDLEKVVFLLPSEAETHATLTASDFDGDCAAITLKKCGLISEVLSPPVRDARDDIQTNLFLQEAQS